MTDEDRELDRRTFIKAGIQMTAGIAALVSSAKDARSVAFTREEGRRLNRMARTGEHTFTPGEVWLDIDGNSIQAHGGGVLYDKGTYYWYGEHKGGKTCKTDTGMSRVDAIGVSCYSSRDLYSWKYEGLVLPAVQDNPAHDLHPSKVMERPKVIYNKKTKQYVMWLHVDTADYRLRSAGLAVSGKPTGPFRYLGSIHPNGLVSADQTVFKDEHGTVYHICSSNWNSCTIMSRLADDYMTPSGEYICVLDYKKQNAGKEAPALCRRECKFYMIVSDCTGWSPNEASYAIADDMVGDWRIVGNPCRGDGAETSFGAQSTFILPVHGRRDAFIFMADRWNPDDLGDSRYVWLPIRWDGEKMIIEWLDRWDLTFFERRH